MMKAKADRMRNSIFTKTLRDKRWFTIGWFFGLMALASLLVVFYPSMHQDGALDQFLGSMPPALQGFIGDLSNLQQFSTYLASQLFDIRMQILVGVMVVVLALNLTAGEEDSGQLRTLVSLPVSRVSILLQKWLAMLVIIAVTMLGTVAGILLTQLTVNESIAPDVLLKLISMTWLVMAVFATITFAAALATGKRAIGTLVGVLCLAGSFMLTTFSVGVEWLRDYERLSIFYYFPAVDIAKYGVAKTDVAVLIVILVVMLALAIAGFRRRDVNG